MRVTRSTHSHVTTESITRLMRISLAVLLVPLLLPSAVAGAQKSDSVTLAPVIVTATRVPTRASSVTQPVTVLLGSDLRARGVTTVAEALRVVPGASIAQSGSFGAVTSLFLRGGESRYTKVLIDGVPVNAVGGTFFFQNLSMNNVERIEVVTGPASALYGADAIAGVIQIFTTRGSGPPMFQISARAGSYGTRQGSASFSGGTRSAGFSLGGGWNQTDGIIPFNNQYSDGTLSGSVRLSPDTQSTVRLTSRYTSSVYHFPTDFSGIPNDTNSYTSQHRLVLGLDASQSVAPAVTLRILGGDNEVHDLSEDTHTAGPATSGFVKTSAPTQGYRRRAEVRIEAAPSPLATVALGAAYEAEAERGSVISYSYLTSPSGVAPIQTPGGDDRRTTRGYYATAQGEALQRLSYDGSVRYDQHSDYKDVTTYHAGAAIRLWSGARVRASYGTGFNAPAFFQTQGSAYNRANGALQPEQARTLDAGVEQGLLSDRIHINLGAFDQRFSQLIQYVAGVTSGPPDYAQITPAYYDNLTQARSKGYEAGARISVTPFWTGSLSYTQVIATVFSVPPNFGGTLRPGDALLRRPSHSGNALVAYARPRLWSAAASANYVGRRPDTDFALFPSPTVTLPAYVKLDIAGSVDLLRGSSRALALTARMENALDRRYEDVLHFPAPRRSLLLGARLEGVM